MHSHSTIIAEQKKLAKSPIWECGNCHGNLIAVENIDIKDTWNKALGMCTPCAKQEYSSRKKS